MVKKHDNNTTTPKTIESLQEKTRSLLSQVFYALDDEGDTNPRLVIPSLNQAFDLVNTPVGTWVRFLRPGMSSKIALQVQRWMDARDRGCSLADAASYALQAKA